MSALRRVSRAAKSKDERPIEALQRTASRRDFSETRNKSAATQLTSQRVPMPQKISPLTSVRFFLASFVLFHHSCELSFLVSPAEARMGFRKVF